MSYRAHLSRQFLILALGASAFAQDEGLSLDPQPEGTSHIEQGPGPQWRVDSVAIVGSRTLDPMVLRGSLKFGVGDTLNSEALADRQRESLRSLMALGLLDDAKVSFEPKGECLLARVEVRELPVVGTIKFVGTKKVTEKDLKEKARLSEGAVLSPAHIERDRQSFLKLYREKGYLQANIVAERGTLVDGRVPLTWRVVEGIKQRVGKIEIMGNVHVSSDDIRSAMKTKEVRWWRSGELSQDTLLQDLVLVKDLFRERGYLDARVDSHQVVFLPDSMRPVTIHTGGSVDADPRVEVQSVPRDPVVRLWVVEGRQYTRGRVSFSGNQLINERQLRAEIILDSGEILNQKKIDAEEQGLRNLYLEEGRLNLRLTPIKTYRDTVVDVLYTIVEGPPSTINEIIIKGNSKTRDKVVRREMRLFPGDLFRMSLMQRSARDIMQLAFFDNVVPDIQPAVQEGQVNLVMNVVEKERGTGTLSAGGAYSQRDGFLATAGVQIPNVFGTGRRIDFNGEVGDNRQSFSLGVTEPWFLDTPTRLGGSLFWRHSIDQNSSVDNDLKSYGFGINLGRRLNWPDDYFYLSSGYNFSFNSNGKLADRTGLIQTDGIESSISATISRDDKDLPVFPTSGSSYSLTLRRVGGPLGGDFDYTQGSASIRWWFPTIEKLVLNLETQGGVLDGRIIQDNDLYLAGGLMGYSGKLRGYDFGSIGRYRAGRSFLSTTAELRYPIADQVFYLLAFADAGNVFGRVSRASVSNADVRLSSPWDDVDMGSLKRDYGLGFRLNIPMMGILGFDFAWGLDPNESTSGESAPNKGMHTNFVIEAPF